MTWLFENDTSAIVKKLAKRSLASEKRRNLMVVVAVALAAFLVCFVTVISVSIAQIQRNQVAGTYEAVLIGVSSRSCNGAVPFCAAWYGGSSISLDGARAEKAIPGRTDAGAKLNLTW